MSENFTSRRPHRTTKYKRLTKLFWLQRNFSLISAWFSGQFLIQFCLWNIVTVKLIFLYFQDFEHRQQEIPVGPRRLRLPSFMRARLQNVNANSKHKSRIWKGISSLKITLSRTRVVTAGNTNSTYFVTLVNLPSTDMCKPNFFSFRKYFWFSGFLVFLFSYSNFITKLRSVI